MDATSKPKPQRSNHAEMTILFYSKSKLPVRDRGRLLDMFAVLSWRLPAGQCFETRPNSCRWVEKMLIFTNLFSKNIFFVNSPSINLRPSFVVGGYFNAPPGQPIHQHVKPTVALKLNNCQPLIHPDPSTNPDCIFSSRPTAAFRLFNVE